MEAASSRSSSIFGSPPETSLLLLSHLRLLPSLLVPYLYILSQHNLGVIIGGYTPGCFSAHSILLGREVISDSGHSWRWLGGQLFALGWKHGLNDTEPYACYFWHGWANTVRQLAPTQSLRDTRHFPSWTLVSRIKWVWRIGVFLLFFLSSVFGKIKRAILYLLLKGGLTSFGALMSKAFLLSFMLKRLTPASQPTAVRSTRKRKTLHTCVKYWPPSRYSRYASRMTLSARLRLGTYIHNISIS